MTDSENDVSAHLLACEEALLDPVVRRDSEQVSKLLADDFLEFGSSGRIWTREAILELLGTEDFKPPAMENFGCALIADRVALVTYRTVSIDPGTGEIAAALRSSLWTKQSGEWRLRFHQGTREARA